MRCLGHLRSRTLEDRERGIGRVRERAAKGWGDDGVRNGCNALLRRTRTVEDDTKCERPGLRNARGHTPRGAARLAIAQFGEVGAKDALPLEKVRRRRALHTAKRATAEPDTKSEARGARQRTAAHGSARQRTAAHGSARQRTARRLAATCVAVAHTCPEDEVPTASRLSAVALRQHRSQLWTPQGHVRPTASVGVCARDSASEGESGGRDWRARVLARERCGSRAPPGRVLGPSGSRGRRAPP
eukprot:2730268-Prymnesium_polylepis.1